MTDVDSLNSEYTLANGIVLPSGDLWMSDNPALVHGRDQWHIDSALPEGIMNCHLRGFDPEPNLTTAISRVVWIAAGYEIPSLNLRTIGRRALNNHCCHTMARCQIRNWHENYET